MLGFKLNYQQPNLIYYIATLQFFKASLLRFLKLDI